MITILHHLGLGDAIMLNGMVRHFAEDEEVCIFVQKHHLESVQFMYRDIRDRVKIKTLNTVDPREMRSQVEGKVLPLATFFSFFFSGIYKPNLFQNDLVSISFKAAEVALKTLDDNLFFNHPSAFSNFLIFRSLPN